MPSSLTCPDDAELLAAAAGERMGEEVRSHLDQCSGCRERLEQIKAELALLQHRAPAAAFVPGAASAVVAGPGYAGGERQEGDPTRSWASPPDDSAAPVAPFDCQQRLDRGEPGDERHPGAIGSTSSSADLPPPARPRSSGWFTPRAEGSGLARRRVG